MRAKTFVLETLVVVNQLGQTTDFACAPIDGEGWKHLEGLIKKNTPKGIASSGGRGGKPMLCAERLPPRRKG